MRAISKNTRKATAITLAAALVVAVYLNWQYARTGVTLEEDAVNVAATVETEEAVSAPIMDGLMTEAEAVSSANKNYGEAQLVSVANNSGSKFFEEARLKRTKAHDEAMDAVQKALKSASLSAEEKKSYTQQLTGSLEDLNAENEIETLVRAKGFADCLCFYSPAGRPDCDDLRRCTDGGTGGADPGHRAQQEQCHGPEHYHRRGKISAFLAGVRRMW